MVTVREQMTRVLQLMAVWSLAGTLASCGGKPPSDNVGAKKATSVRNATFNRAALPPMDAALTSDPSRYPAPEVRARLHLTQMRSREDSRVENRIWTRFRTGQ
jgi:hypothetical protein